MKPSKQFEVIAWAMVGSAAISLTAIVISVWSVLR